MEDDRDDNSQSSTTNSMAFKLLSRDTKGRLEARQLLVPQSNLMAQKVMKAEEAARLEKQRLKERVLQINQMTEDVNALYHVCHVSLVDYLLTTQNVRRMTILTLPLKQPVDTEEILVFRPYSQPDRLRRQ
jgi:hypothetical protein